MMEQYFAGSKVWFARLDLGLTQKQLAEKLGVTREYINYIENDKKPLTRQLINKLVKITGKPSTHWR